MFCIKRKGKETGASRRERRDRKTKKTEEKLKRVGKKRTAAKLSNGARGP